jgi:hypothetical protein
MQFVHVASYLALLPRALWNYMPLHKALEVFLRPICSRCALVRACAKGVIVLRVLPRFSLEIAHYAVIWRQYGSILSSVVQTPRYSRNVSCQAAEDGDALRLPYDIGYDHAGGHFSRGRHNQVVQRRLLEGLPDGIERARLCGASEEQAHACERVGDQRSGFHGCSGAVRLAMGWALVCCDSSEARTDVMPR